MASEWASDDGRDIERNSKAMRDFGVSVYRSPAAAIHANVDAVEAGLAAGYAA